MTISIWKKSNPNPAKAHVVADVHFEKGHNANDSPCSCVCGWQGTVIEYAEHRNGPKRRVLGLFCPNGHVRTPSNTYIDPHGWRRCVICHRAATERHRERRRAA